MLNGVRTMKSSLAVDLSGSRTVDVDAAIQELWGKSDAGGRPHMLVSHLMDSAAVAEIVWDRFMAPSTRETLDQVSGRHGRDLFVLLCLWHDLGKASPEFQAKSPDLAAPVTQRGLPFPHVGHSAAGHAAIGAAIADDYLRGVGQDAKWWCALIAGHHGRYGSWRRKSFVGRGVETWLVLQQRLAESLAAAVGVEVASIGWNAPPVGVQLALGGYLSMVDWIASSEEFPGTGSTIVTIGEARHRAETAWARMGLGGTWESGQLMAGQGDFPERFGNTPHPSQVAAMTAATEMGSSGLLLIEAPMGEGKTEAGLAAAEILSRRFGLNGVAFAMPTQGTTDAMYARCTKWMESVDASVPVSLHHGKAMLNEQWRDLLDGQTFSEIGDDDFGVDDPYGVPAQQAGKNAAVSSWLLGRHRGLLSPVAVATVDQVLYAATRTKFVQLRHAGLAGKVLLVDEVHSYDVFMGVFLHRLLEWCRLGGVPVVMMSATLSPQHRNQILSASAGVPVEVQQESYPLITRVEPGSPVPHTYPARPSRSDLPVTVEIANPGDVDDVQPIARRAADLTADGGVALVVVDTVARAQETYAVLARDGVPVRLVHGRLTTRARADRTADLVDVLGPAHRRGSGRPDRLVVVATQIAEQSFDVDVDVLVTDIAPVDLLLQRIGRLHRHLRPETDRPNSLRQPRVIVTGYRSGPEGPVFAGGLDRVYEPSSLVRTAALLARAERDGRPWLIPSDIPTLVRAGYEPNLVVPAGWAEMLRERDAEALAAGRRRRDRADTFALEEPDELTDLVTLHRRAAAATEDEAATVRDGDLGVEVALVRSAGEGYRTLTGRPLGTHGEVATGRLDVAREVLGDTVRIRRTWPWLRSLQGLPAWRDDPVLGHQVAIVLDDDGQATLSGDTVRYDADLGLLIEPGRGR